MGFRTQLELKYRQEIQTVPISTPSTNCCRYKRENVLARSLRTPSNCEHTRREGKEEIIFLARVQVPLSLTPEAMCITFKQWEETTGSSKVPPQPCRPIVPLRFLAECHRRWVLAWTHSQLSAGPCQDLKL